MKTRIKKSLPYLALGVSLLLTGFQLQAGSLMEYYRKIGDKLTRPDVSKSNHPIVKERYVRPGVFIDTETPLVPTLLSEEEGIKREMDGVLEEIAAERSGNKQLSRRLEEFREQKCFLNRAEKEVLDEKNVMDILAVQNSHHFYESIAKKLATRPSKNVLPTPVEGESYTYQKAYEGIRRFLGNPSRVIYRLRELEREVLILKRAHPEVNPQLHLQEVLARWERHSGFNPAVVLPAKILSGQEWFQMLKDGSLFYDLYWEPRWYEPHGAETHRIQWHLVQREMEDYPEEFFKKGDEIKAVKIFQEMGNGKLMKNLSWPKKLKKGEKSLWYQTVDTEEMNFTGPVLTRWLVKKMKGLSDSK